MPQGKKIERDEQRPCFSSCYKQAFLSRKGWRGYKKRVERIQKDGGEDTEKEKGWREYKKRVERIEKKGGENTKKGGKDREKGWRGHRNRVARIQKKAGEDTEIRWRGYRKKDREDTEK